VLRLWLSVCLALSVLAGSGCASSRAGQEGQARPFRFGADTFAYQNELVWDYGLDEAGAWRGRPRDPVPDYVHRCFVMARSVKQFFLHARFDPEAGAVDDLTYRYLIREVLRSSPRHGRDAERRVVIPGYRDLYEFSDAWGWLLQAESGGAWGSYFQRGHWRMVFPFSRRHQERMARALEAGVERDGLVVVHLVRFPGLQINHAVVVFDAVEEERGVQFSVYDPNTATGPVTLRFDRVRRQFEFASTAYYRGGPLKVYEIYRGICY
jgi:hypothetical protein